MPGDTDKIAKRMDRADAFNWTPEAQLERKLMESLGLRSTKAERKEKKLSKRNKRAYDQAFGEFNSGVDGQSSAEKAMLERSLSLLKGTGPLRDLQNDAMDAAEDPAGRINQAIGRGRQDVHAKFAEGGTPRSIGDAVGQNLARARALTRVGMAGDEAVKAQALKDRIAIAGFGRDRANLAMGQGQIGVDMAAKRRAAADDRNAVTGAAYSNLGGAVLGAGLNYGINAWQNRLSPVKVTAQPMLAPIDITAQRIPTPAPAAPVTGPR
jgi:hypothetical protein